MKIIIIDDLAFRVTNAGVVESTQYYPKTGRIVHERGMGNAWKVESGSELGMSGGELHTIREMLLRLAQLFPEGRTGLPESERTPSARAEATEPR